jgi:hypothetical protein
MKTPCKNCLIVPMCKYKRYRSLVESCDIVTDFLYRQVNEYDILISKSKWNAKYRRATFGIRANYVANDLNASWYYLDSVGVIRNVE